MIPTIITLAEFRPFQVRLLARGEWSLDSDAPGLGGLTGTIRGNRWEWDGQGEPVDQRGRRIEWVLAWRTIPGIA